MKSWMKFGLVWGVFMFLVLNIGFPLIDGTAIKLKQAIVSFPVWIIFGLIFGYVSQGRKKVNKKL